MGVKGHGRTTKFSKKQIEGALRAGRGVYALAARALSNKDPEKGPLTTCSPNTIKKAVERDPKLLALKQELLDGVLDLAEGKLFQQIDNGNMTAIIFFLKCHGKKRGYIERVVTEVTGKDGGPVMVGDAAKVAKTIASMSPEQIRALANAGDEDLAPEPTPTPSEDFARNV